MKSFLLLAVIGIFVQYPLMAQDSSTITIRAGQNVADVMSPAEVFYYPQFINGNVFFRDGRKSSGKLNYNRLLDEMHFIDAGGDTLALTDEKTIRQVVIAADTFYYHEGYLRLIIRNEVSQLAIRQVWKLANKRKGGAYNTSSSVSSVSSRNSYFDGRRFHSITVKEDVVLSRINKYYIGDTHNRFVVAGQKNLQQLFPKEYSLIKNYVKENSVDFENKESLQKLMHFLEEILKK